MAGAGGEATGGHTHFFTLCVHKRVKWSFDVSLRYCRIQWCDKTRLSRYVGHSLLLFSHPQKTHGCGSESFHTLTVHMHFCLQNPLVRQGSYVKVCWSLCIYAVTRWTLTCFFICSSDFFLFVLLLKPYEKPPEKGECRTVHVKPID